MRLVDADAFDERVRAAGGMAEEELTEDFKDGVQAVLYMLSNQPTIQPEPHWIPVTERLPENNGEYLVTVKWVTGESDVDVYEYDARHKTWNDGESAGGERAVAWAKLPEPYKGVTT